MTQIYHQITEAVEAIRTSCDIKPTVGLVLGSGLGAVAKSVSAATTLAYHNIPHFPQSGVPGHAGHLVLGEIDGVSVAVMCGRVHYYEGHTMERSTLSLRVLAGLGVKNVIVTNAAGAVNPNFHPGDLMVIADHLNLTGDNPLRGSHDDRLGCRFVDMSAAYPQDLRQYLHQAGREVGVKMHEGIYAGLAGPTYETPAEISMLQRLGADVVGMSTVPEVIVAAQSGMRVAGLSVVSNYGAGLVDQALSHDDVTAMGQKVSHTLCDLLTKATVLMG